MERVGAGPKTAVIAAVALWFGGYLLSLIGDGMVGLYPAGLLTMWGAVGLAEMIISALIGGAIYQERKVQEDVLASWPANQTTTANSDVTSSTASSRQSRATARAAGPRRTRRLRPQRGWLVDRGRLTDSRKSRPRAWLTPASRTSSRPARMPSIVGRTVRSGTMPTRWVGVPSG